VKRENGDLYLEITKLLAQLGHHKQLVTVQKPMLRGTIASEYMSNERTGQKQEQHTSAKIYKLRSSNHTLQRLHEYWRILPETPLKSEDLDSR
jgi:hypothetical protein